MSLIVGIDVGGTFTDLFRFDSSARTFTTAKVPSRRGDEASGFINGLRALGGLFHNAYANAENERAALKAVREVWPNDYVTASHEVLSEIREFERASTAALNAYLQPVVASYIAKLESALARESKARI